MASEKRQSQRAGDSDEGESSRLTPGALTTQRAQPEADTLVTVR